ncbi:hypothetical protein WR25_13168 [Diploscapter pachys]|uniref:Uncharacterized protein n=1 Tax=Diploscapter pachys TaxID=2018661 RepID=A0A2A2LKT1_9BILA|nr:hypothetical protein WR25_13168 [Diploscapter pachys]
MAESKRIRDTMGDDVGSAYSASRASRRGSLSQTSGDELPSYKRPSLSISSSYKARQGSTDTSASYTPSTRFTTYSYSRPDTLYRPSTAFMSRSYSPIRSPIDLFSGVPMDHSLPTVPVTKKENEPGPGKSTTNEKKLPPPDESEITSSEDEEQRKKREETMKPKKLDEKGGKDRASQERKKRSSRERTSRRNSRNSSKDLHSSSSEEESRLQSRDSSRQRRRRRKKDPSRDRSESSALPPKAGSKMSKSMSTSMVDSTTSSIHSAIQTGIAELSNLVAKLSDAGSVLPSTREEPPQSPKAVQETPLSPHLSRSSSKHGVVKNQIIKSPSLVEVMGVSKSESNSKLCSTKTDESSIPEDSQHDAVAHFRKQFKTKIKPLAPVPGVWTTGHNDEFISKNKAFMS